MEINNKSNRKFKELSVYNLQEKSSYYLLPFRFHRLTPEKEIIVNEVGDYLILDNGTYQRIVLRKINKIQEEY